MNRIILTLLLLPLSFAAPGWSDIQPSQCTSVGHLESFYSGLQLLELRKIPDRQPTDSQAYWAPLQTLNGRSGLNFDFCEFDPDCELPRMCATFGSNEEIVPCSGFNCFCYTPDICCENDSQCDQDESCVSLMNESVCVSDSVPLPRRGSNLNGEPCFTLLDCLPPRECVLQQTPDSRCLHFLNDECICMSQDSGCTNNGDCDENEICERKGLPSSLPTCMAPFSFINERVNGERCLRSTSCKGSRICSLSISVDFNSTQHCQRGDECVCTTLDATCVWNTDCDDTESCVQVGQHMVCVSKRIINSKNPASTGPILPQETPFSSSEAFLFPSSTSFPSITLPLVSPSVEECGTQLDCEPNEECVVSNGTGSCIANAFSEESICIAVESLQRTGEDKLLYRRHLPARVVCDRAENCATAGHMVLFRGEAMMMKSYCAIVGCDRMVKLVNSPRYQRGWRGSTLESNLFFTAFAARYEAVLEEQVLAFAIRIGL